MRDDNERGMALVATILILALVGALLVGFVEIVMSDQKAGGAARDQTQAYAAAHAGMEKLTSDLGTLFAANYAPTCDEIDALAATGQAPTLPGITFSAPGGGDGSGYSITYKCEDGEPVQEESATIASGKYQGFEGLITHYTITVTARTASGAEVRMRREMQTVAIPVFQFGMFSENDLSFFAGPNFNFGGRVHTNGNLFVAEGDGKTLTLADRVTVYGEVIRKNLANGWLTQGNGYGGTVKVAKSSSATTAMGFDQGSWGAATPQLPGTPTGVALTPLNDPKWTTFSVTTTNGYMTNNRTGATRLDLPLAQMGAAPIDLIRRPAVDSSEDTANSAVFKQRYFAMASLRILLSDNAEDLTGLPTITSGAPVYLPDLAAAGYVVGATTPPIAKSPSTTALSTAGNHLTPANTPLVGGYLKIEMQKADGSWKDVTLEILNRGIAGRNLSNGTLNTPGTACTEPNPDAIIRLQRLRDNPSAGGCGNGSTVATDYWPNVLYDAREGLFRDYSSLTTEHRHFLGGIMHYVELDAKNLSDWMADQGSDIMQQTGYVVYFSDRRGNWHDPDNDNKETGEYGFEDVVNLPLSAGYPGNGSYSNPATYNSGATPETGEDFNADGQLQTYGAIPSASFSAPLDANAKPWTPLLYNYSGTGGGYSLSMPIAARVNPPILFRRALKVVNGTKGNIISPGLTVVAENPLYVQGNYNADAGGFGATGDGHAACAMIADAVTLLSNQWNDIKSFLSAHDPSGGNLGSATLSPGRVATGDVYFRFAVAAGKGLSFERPSAYTTYQDFGTDGGAHNFLRYLEDLDAITINYKGSIVSFYNSRQAVGTYKCCNNVYKAPGRGYSFDAEFLTPSLLPPRTPMFRDVNVLTFRQILRATQ